LDKEKGEAAIVDKELNQIVDSGLWWQLGSAYRVSYEANRGVLTSILSPEETIYYVREVQPELGFFR
jgi:hypothetical protein